MWKGARKKEEIKWKRQKRMHPKKSAPHVTQGVLQQPTWSIRIRTTEDNTEKVRGRLNGTTENCLELQRPARNECNLVKYDDHESLRPPAQHAAYLEVAKSKREARWRPTTSTGSLPAPHADDDAAVATAADAVVCWWVQLARGSLMERASWSQFLPLTDSLPPLIHTWHYKLTLPTIRRPNDQWSRASTNQATPTPGPHSQSLASSQPANDRTSTCTQPKPHFLLSCYQ